ncbi:MAG: CoB--CoM heterodisulfide reductase iron-sulfur subunit B family protein [Dysgonamonadaceae bacterium]|jgi:heterodisulfide reductase subunit B|nr:CoB--CoM heterodisulfide reductase iron-sulfur subunit B family protein [Dysgonamonadaceae bacterium]
MIETGFYPGCSLQGTSSEYAQSTLALARVFDIRFVDIPDWNCCGATAAHNCNHELALALPARILALAEKQGLTEIVVPCAACYNRLNVAQHELNNNKELKEQVSEIISMPVSGNILILNIMQFIEKYIAKKISEKIVKPFSKKVACYYGCLLVRPGNILKFDSVENPQSMDKLMQEIGSQTIDWPFKTECCGAGLSVSRTDLVGKLSGKIIGEALDRNAEAIIVACPMCHSNLDMRRPAINRFLGLKTTIPVIYITQAIGMACGLSEAETGIRKHLVKVNIN